MLLNLLTPETSRHGTELSTVWFQQDGATTHTARASTQFVEKPLPEHVTSLRGKIPWPRVPPDLSVCLYFLGVTSK